jgi:hypothetical protein
VIMFVTVIVGSVLGRIETFIAWLMALAAGALVFAVIPVRQRRAWGTRLRGLALDNAMVFARIIVGFRAVNVVLAMLTGHWHIIGGLDRTPFP